MQQHKNFGLDNHWCLLLFLSHGAVSDAHTKPGNFGLPGIIELNGLRFPTESWLLRKTIKLFYEWYIIPGIASNWPFVSV